MISSIMNRKAKRWANKERCGEQWPANSEPDHVVHNCARPEGHLVRSINHKKDFHLCSCGNAKKSLS